MMIKNSIFKAILPGFLLLSLGINGQVRIGNTAANADASALLDVVSDNKGLLLPRVKLSSNDDTATIPNPANGLMVYNTAAAGLGTKAVKANMIYTWKVDKWESAIDLINIRTLKVPIDYILQSKSNQIYTAAENTTLNTTTNAVPVNWSATEIVLDNPNDVLLSSAENLMIKRDSFYQISGSFTFAVSTATAGAASYAVVSLQLSTDGGSTWTDRCAAAMTYEKDNIAPGDTTTDFPKPQTIVFPNFVLRFAKDDVIRFVISKSTGAPSSYFITGTGLQSRVSGDVTKTVRLTRLSE